MKLGERERERGSERERERSKSRLFPLPNLIWKFSAPSEVQKLDVVYPNGKPKVTWQAPAIPAGPIDGYLVRFYNSTNDPPQKQEDIGKVLEYSPSNVVNCTK